MSLAYLSKPGTRVTRRGDRLIVSAKDAEPVQLTLCRLSALLCYGPVVFTRPALDAIADAGLPVGMLSSRGALRSRLLPAVDHHTPRLGQLLTLDRPRRRVEWGRHTASRKLRAARQVLMDARGRPEPVRSALTRIDDSLSRIDHASTLSRIRGLEGIAARAYWTAFPCLLRGDLPMRGRSKRPPKDPVNAMLSVGYTMLAQETAGVLETLGIDSHLGYLHSPRGRGPALALDVMEPFRHRVIDRMVLREINLRRFQRDDFRDRHGGVQLKPAAFRRFAEAYDRALTQPRRHLAGGARCLRALLLFHCHRWAQRFHRRGQRRLDALEEL